MKRNKTWFSLGLVALSALALTLILMVLPAGAAHNDPDIVGTVTVDPEAVSPDEGVGLKARTITVTVTDPNLNTIQFVGTGPNGEEAGDPQEPITIPGDATGIGSFLMALGDTDNDGIGNAIADRNHDGEVDASDLQIVIRAAADGNVTAGQVGVASILNAERGQVYFNTFARGLNGDKFDVRYATSSRELTRAKATYNRTIHANSQAGFDDELDSTPQDIEGLDVTVFGAYASKVRVTNSGATATFEVVEGMLANPGDEFVVRYEIEEEITVGESVDVDPDTDANAIFSVVLGRTPVDRNGDGDVDHDDIGELSNNSVTATDYDADGNEVTFTLSAGTLSETGMFTVQYRVEETVIVPGEPLGGGDTFKFNLDKNHLPLRDGADEDIDIAVDDITIKIDGNTLAFAKVTATMEDPGMGDNDGVFTGKNLLTLTLAPDATPIPANTEIKITYLGYEDLVTVEGDGVPMTLRLLETASSSGIFKATVVVVNGDAAAATDSKGIGGNANLKPSAVTAAADRPKLAVSDGSSVIVRYTDKSPVRTATARVGRGR